MPANRPEGWSASNVHGGGGYEIAFSVSFAIGPPPPRFAIRLPRHVAAAMDIEEVESALFTEYVRGNGDKAFLP